MPRITFTVPILPGRQDEVVRLLAKYKKQLEGAHAAVDAVQWFIFVDRDEYLCNLMDDPRIDGVLSSLLGDDYNYEASDGRAHHRQVGDG